MEVVRRKSEQDLEDYVSDLRTRFGIVACTLTTALNHIDNQEIEDASDEIKISIKFCAEQFSSLMLEQIEESRRKKQEERKAQEWMKQKEDVKVKEWMNKKNATSHQKHSVNITKDFVKAP